MQCAIMTDVSELVSLRDTSKYINFELFGYKVFLNEFLLYGIMNSITMVIILLYLMF